MSSTLQVTLNNEREIQLAKYVQTRPDLQNLGQTDAVKKILYGVMDPVVPLEEKK